MPSDKSCTAGFRDNKVVEPFKFPSSPHEFKIVGLRECPTPDELQLCDSPDPAADYWRLHVPTHPWFDLERECLIVLMLNVRRRVKGHYLVSIGTRDTLLVNPLHVFRLAVACSAAAIIIIHNHPSGDPAPSETDIAVTHDLVKAGEILKIEVLDHLVMGAGTTYHSLKALGHFNKNRKRRTNRACGRNEYA